MSSLELLSVKCIKPSSGTSEGVRDILNAAGGVVGGVAGGVAGAAVTAASMGTLVVAVGVGAVGGATGGYGLTDTIVGKLDQYFSGKDDLYINVNGNKVWPDGETYHGIDSQDVVQVNKTFDLHETVTIELMEYDTIGSDDNMGGLKVSPHEEQGYHRYSVINADENTIYEIEYEVYE